MERREINRTAIVRKIMVGASRRDGKLYLRKEEQGHRAG
jgi:hypothetical protein